MCSTAKLYDLDTKINDTTDAARRNSHTYRSQQHGFEATFSFDAAPVCDHLGCGYGRG
jgi:hypothetical protein